MNHTINDALRMTGQLLLHHGTTGNFACNSRGNDVPWHVPQATCWCLDGAFKVCCKQLGIQEAGWADLKQTLGWSWHDSLWNTWDEATDDQREAWATLLADVKNP